MHLNLAESKIKIELQP